MCLLMPASASSCTVIADAANVLSFIGSIILILRYWTREHNLCMYIAVVKSDLVDRNAA